jgi:hypothetical protein
VKALWVRQKRIEYSAFFKAYPRELIAFSKSAQFI